MAFWCFLLLSRPAWSLGLITSRCSSPRSFPKLLFSGRVDQTRESGGNRPYLIPDSMKNTADPDLTRCDSWSWPGLRAGGGGYSQKNWVGVCGPLPKTLTLFMTKICDISYPIYDLTKNSKPNLWPDPHIKILFQTCILISSVVQTNFKLP